MKTFILITTIAAIANFIVAGIITFFIFKKKELPKKKKFIVQITVFLIVGLVLFFAGGAVYFGSYYRADERAKSYLTDDNDVKVIEIDKGYLFDGPGEDTAYIFYPGAKVEPTSYAAVLHNLSAKGIDCFLVKMPLNMAMLGKEYAGEIMADYDYDKWYLGGHSLGGAMASLYASEHENDIDGMILMAAYSPRKLRDGMKLISIAGDNDKVLKWEAYKTNITNWPKNAVEYIIKGGNHAGFGDYGKQQGDGKATISSEEQQRQAVDEIIKMIDNK